MYIKFYQMNAEWMSATSTKKNTQPKPNHRSG